MAALVSLAVYSEEVPISGVVASKCVIHTDTPGVYGNPSAHKLSTLPSDGGVTPIIRYDVVSAGNYKAVITTPVNFTTSPALNDTLTWFGETSVSAVTNASMSAYDTNKRIYNNTTEFDLSVAGTVWFKSTSKVEYGVNKSLPGGTYRAVVTAECIAL